MTNEIKLTARPFEMGTEKEAANKVQEEANEAVHAWRSLVEDEYPTSIAEEMNASIHRHMRLADEIADTIQAACNLAARYGIDLQAAMERCERRNRERGRYGDANTNEVRESSVGDTAIRRWMDSDSGGNNSPTCACDRSGVVDSDGSRDAHYKATKSPEEMSVAELIEALKATNSFYGECEKILGDDFCDGYDTCRDCRNRLLDLLETAYEREVLRRDEFYLAKECTYLAEECTKRDKKIEGLNREIADLTHERDGLRRRLEELSEAGITELHRLLRETLGEAKNIAHNARVYIGKQQGSNNERCGDCGSIGRNHGGDCCAERVGERVLSEEPPAQEMSEREKVLQRLREINFTQKKVYLDDIGRAVLGCEPTSWWSDESRAALRDKLIELIGGGGAE